MNTDLRVAVCTNRPAAAVAESLAALRDQVPEGSLALVLNGPGDAAADGVVLLHEPAPGLSRARNRALHWAGDADVLAFVDDDAVVEPDWFSALRGRWDEAPADVACIGGPIRPRFAVP